MVKNSAFGKPFLKLFLGAIFCISCNYQRFRSVETIFLIFLVQLPFKMKTVSIVE